VLVGYSGGGTLAWLMAREVPQTVAVVTIAANLDVERWAALHGYTPLAGSLDPARSPPLPPAVAQVNFAGARDTDVPPEVAVSFGRRHRAAKLVVIEDYDHRCCWTQRWPELLSSANAWGGLAPAPMSGIGVLAAE
jgi:poly(3-hydroxybutyrate) depolymerase